MDIFQHVRVVIVNYLVKLCCFFQIDCEIIIYIVIYIYYI